MDNLSTKTLALFFTRGMSLDKWHELGQIAREVKLYTALANRFKTVYLFTYGTEKDLSHSNLFPKNVVIVPRAPGIPSLIYSFLLPFVRKDILKGVDVIKTNQMDGSWAAVLAKKIFGVKLIVRCGYEWLSFIEQGGRAWWKKAIAWVIEKCAYSNADTIIITSHSDKEFIVKRFSISHEKIAVIPNFVDTELFHPAEEQGSGGRLIFVGRLEPQKNVVNLCHALKDLPVTLSIAGGGGSLYESVQEVIKADGILVEWLGSLSQTQLAEALRKSGIFVMPSRYEGSPKALLEAMASGLACIGGDNPETREIIKDGENGLISGLDSDSIHACLARLLTDDILKKQLGLEARSTILNGFSFDQYVKQELALYQKLL